MYGVYKSEVGRGGGVGGEEGQHRSDPNAKIILRWPVRFPDKTFLEAEKFWRKNKDVIIRVPLDGSGKLTWYS